MAGVGPTDLHDLATEFLDACIEALDTIPDFEPTLGGAPPRTFVGYGPVALDCCEQLAVYVGALTVRTNAIDARINNVSLTAVAARCVPVPDSQLNPPPATEQEAAGRQVNADKWALWNHISNLIDEGLLFDRCCGVEWGPLSPLQPNGGCGGSQLTLTVCFDGYDELLGS